MKEKECLYLCMGSACHQLGVYEVLPKLQALLQEYELEERVELKGGFCLGECAQGIVMQYRDTTFLNVRPFNVEQKFRDEILPEIMNGEGTA